MENYYEVECQSDCDVKSPIIMGYSYLLHAPVEYPKYAVPIKKAC